MDYKTAVKKHWVIFANGLICAVIMMWSTLVCALTWSIMCVLQNFILGLIFVLFMVYIIGYVFK